MRNWRHKISGAIALLRVIGLRKFGCFLIHYIATSPVLWEWVLVKKVRGKRLSRAMGGLSSWRSKALVSVVLPVNNGRSRGVERLVASLKSQTHEHIEFIAVDSGSTDDTVVWLKGEGFNVIEIDPSSFTHAYSRNMGAAAARGDYLLFTVDDAVFFDPDWLRSAIYLMKRFEAESMSSRQTVDDKADAYARCLDRFLSYGQSDRLGVNLSRDNCFSRWIRHIMPLRPQVRSVSIDDTNHLVCKAAFDRIRFHAPTVEDIDFALKLTKAGGRTLYTNLLSILHYHAYDEAAFAGYARRVFIDTKVIGRWQPYVMSFASREGFLVAALHALVLFFKAFELADHTYYVENTKLRNRRGVFNIVGPDYFKIVLDLTQELDSAGLGVLQFRRSGIFEDACKFYVDIMGDRPPSDIYRIDADSDYIIRCLRNDLDAAKSALFVSASQTYAQDDIKTIFKFLWVNRVMSHLARPEIFKQVEITYPFDEWNIKNWA